MEKDLETRKVEALEKIAQHLENIDFHLSPTVDNPFPIGIYCIKEPDIIPVDVITTKEEN